MSTHVTHHHQRGMVLLAVMVLLMVVAAAVMVSKANRISNSGTNNIAARQSLMNWLPELKYALVTKALQESSTPGAMPCPNEQPYGCSVPNAAGSPPALGTLRLPNSTLQGVCIQYVVAPSVRSTVQTSERGTASSKRPINPTFLSDLTFVDATGNSMQPWALLIARPAESGGCSLAQLGYNYNYDSTTGLAKVFPTPDSDNSAIVLTVEKKDLMRALLELAVQSVDTGTLRTYLVKYLNDHGATSTYLSLARSSDPTSFDAAFAPAGATLAPPPGSTCQGIVTTSSSKNYDKPVSWLCFNAWYDEITFNQPDSSFEITDTESGMTCTRKGGNTCCASQGKTSCTS